jgi:hypothetical protein
MAANLLEPVHKAEDELKIGLANLDRQQVKQTYNELIAVELEFWRKYLKPYSDHLGLKNAD